VFAQVIASAAPSPARQVGSFALVLLVFAGIVALLGSQRLRPPAAGRFAQAQGRWTAFRWMRWPLLIAGTVAATAALILSLAAR
jgi:hypothetical protein